MKQGHSTSSSSPQTPSLADTLSAGFGVFLRRPWVLLVSLLVDVWLLWGVRIAPHPVGQWFRQFGNRLGEADQTAIRALAANVDAADVRTVGLIAQLFPSLLRTSSHPSTSGLVWTPPNGWVLLAIIIGLNGAALLLSSLQLVPLAQAVRGERTNLATMLAIGRAWWRLGQYIMLLLTGGLLFTLPALLAMLMLAVAVPLVAQLAVVVWVTVLVIGWLFTSFGIEAIVVGGTSPTLALYQSYNLVRRYWRSAALLLAAIFIVAEGAVLLLLPLLTTPVQALIALTIYGVISGTLSAARMVFYQRTVAQLVSPQPTTLVPSQ